MIKKKPRTGCKQLQAKKTGWPLKTRAYVKLYGTYFIV